MVSLAMLFHLSLLFIAFNPITSRQSENNVVSFSEAELLVHEKEVSVVSFSFNETNLYENGTAEKIGIVHVYVDDVDLAIVVNGSDIIVREPGNQNMNNYSLFIEGIFVGRTTLRMKSENMAVIKHTLPIAVLRTESSNKLTQIFSIFMAIIVCINTFIMGLQLEKAILLKIMKKPTGLLIGFICQFGFMPLIASGWGYLLLKNSPNLLFGLFTVGCSPGGGNSNSMTILFDGNINLSITMTFFSNIAALAMMPMWIYTLGTVFYQSAGGKSLQIPFINIVVSLVLLIAPVFVGLIFKHFKPVLAAKIASLVKYTSIAIILIVVPFGIYANFYLFSLINWSKVLCGMLLPYTGFALAFVVAKILRQNVPDCRTIAIETGIQNGSIAIVLLQFSLPHPDSDLALVMPLCVILMTPLPLLILLLIKTVYEKCFLKQSRKVGDVEDPKPEPIANNANEQEMQNKIEEIKKDNNAKNNENVDLEFKFDNKRNSVHL